MWPLSGARIAEVCALPFTTEQASALGGRSFSAVLTGQERGPRRDDIVFAVADADGALARSAAEAGALVVAPPEHASIFPRETEPPVNVVFVASPLRCLRALARFIRHQIGAPVVAVGGCNGKTTTKEMIAAVLSGRTASRVTHTPGTNNGWLGIPITLCHPLHRRAEPPDAVVVEIGIDALGAMEHHLALVAPDIAVISTLGPEHIEGLGTTAQAVEEELRLFESPRVRRVWMIEDAELGRRAPSMASSEDIVVFEERGDDPPVAGRRVSFRVLDEDLGSGDGGWRTRVAVSIGEGQTLQIDVPLPGRHNVRNAALSCGVGLLVGLSAAEIEVGFSRFRPLEQRCATTALPGDCLLIDDTYNASPKSMLAALDVVTRVPLREHVVVLGDMLELGAESRDHHDEVARRLLDSGIRHVFLVGEAMRAVYDRLLARRAAFSTLRWCEVGEPPESLLEWPHWDGCAVLVKGSRGTRMERHARLVEARQRARSSAGPCLLVLGADRAKVAHRARVALGPDPLRRLHVLDDAAVLRGDHRGVPIESLVLAGFAPSSEERVEAELAVLAQPILLLAPPARVFALGIPEEATAALREVLPPGVVWLPIQTAEEVVGATKDSAVSADAVATTEGC